MGLDLLDMTFRLEKSFGVKFPESYLDEVFHRRPELRGRRVSFRLREPLLSRGKSSFDIQAGQVHEFVCRYLSQKGLPIPRSSWHRVQVCIATALGVSLRRIKPESWLVKDLGCN
jgi:hypothetical protein